MKTIKEILILMILFFLVNPTYSQSITFKKVIPSTVDFNPGGFNVECKPSCNNKSFIITTGAILLKLNNIGDLILIKAYLNNGYFVHSIFNKDSSLTFYVDMIASDKKILKIDTSLNLISVKKYDSLNWWQAIIDRTVICPTINNGFLLSGRKGISMPVIAKIDSSDNILWSKYFTPIKGGIQDMVQTQDSGFVIATNLNNATASLIKTDKNGDVLWAKSYFRPHGFIHNVLENADGTMLITGNIDSSYNSSPLFFVKLNQAGNVIWAKTFGDTYNSKIRYYASYTRHTQDGGFITLTTLVRPSHNDDLLLVKTDFNGDTLWVRVHGSPQSFDYGQSVEQLNDKGYIITGVTNNNIPVPLSSLYVIRTDSLGRTDSLCEEYNFPLTINNITVNDSNFTVTSVPFIVHTSISDTSTQSFYTYAYDGCHLDAIPELYLEQTAPLLIYPNPSEGKFTIEMKMSTPLKTEIEIYNINGEKVYSAYTVDASSDIDLTGFSRGLYFVKMSNERWVKTGKVMVE